MSDGRVCARGEPQHILDREDDDCNPLAPVEELGPRLKGQQAVDAIGRGADLRLADEGQRRREDHAHHEHGDVVRERREVGVVDRVEDPATPTRGDAVCASARAPSPVRPSPVRPSPVRPSPVRPSLSPPRCPASL
eukprot:5029543-Prymnesium_polylepis.1